MGAQLSMDRQKAQQMLRARGDEQPQKTHASHGPSDKLNPIQHAKTTAGNPATFSAQNKLKARRLGTLKEDDEEYKEGTENSVSDTLDYQVNEEDSKEFGFLQETMKQKSIDGILKHQDFN